MFRYGLPVWHGNISSIEDEVERAATLGFDYVEVSLDFPWPETLGKTELRKIFSAARKNEIAFSFHAPPAGMEIGSPRELIRMASVEFMANLLSWTRQFSPLYFNFHGDAGEDFSGLSEEEVEMAVLRASVQSCGEIAAVGKKLGIVATFENTPEPLFGMGAYVEAIVNSSKVNFCLDVGHAGIINWVTNEAVGKDDRHLSKWVSALGKRMAAVHFHNIKKGIDHYPVFSGELDLAAQMKLLKKKTRAKFMTIEVLKEARGPVEKVSDRTLVRCLDLVKAWEAGGKTGKGEGAGK